MNQEDEDFVESLQADEDGRDGSANFTDETIPGIAAGIFDAITIPPGEDGRDGEIDEEDGECTPPEIKPVPPPSPSLKDRNSQAEAAIALSEALSSYNDALDVLNKENYKVTETLQSMASSVTQAGDALADGIFSWNSAQSAICAVKAKKKEIQNLEAAREAIIEAARAIGDQAKPLMRGLNIPPNDNGMRAALGCVRSNPFTGGQIVDSSPRCAGFKNATAEQWATFNNLRGLWSKYLEKLKELAAKDKEIKKAQNELRRLEAQVPNVYTREHGIRSLRMAYDRAIAAYSIAQVSLTASLKSFEEVVSSSAATYNGLRGDLPVPQVDYEDFPTTIKFHPCPDGSEVEYTIWEKVVSGKSPARPDPLNYLPPDSPSLPGAPSVFTPPVSDQC